MAPVESVLSPRPTTDLKSDARRTLVLGLSVFAAFAAVSTQMVRLALRDHHKPTIARLDATANHFSRPDIVDRRGRLLATDVGLPTMFADPSTIHRVDETIEKLSQVFPGLNTAQNRKALSNRKSKYVLLRRSVSPGLAEQVHAMGLPGIHFKYESRRGYPAGRVAGHVLGAVDGSNKGTLGIERFLNSDPGVRHVHGARVNAEKALRLSIDMSAQFAIEQELVNAIGKYKAEAATSIVIDVDTGEVLSAVSVPRVDPSEINELLDRKRRNRFADDVYELGSVFKPITIAMALETGVASPHARIDVSEPLRFGKFTIKDPHRDDTRLSLTQVLVYSSNVGSGILAGVTGAKKQRAFLARLGLIDAVDFPDIKTAPPKLPRFWGKAATATIGYGHGISVSPLQFAIANASLVNGGYRVRPTFLAQSRQDAVNRATRVLKQSTSDQVRRMLRENVRYGTGKLAAVPGYDVGGKTGTADLVNKGVYDGKSVITSFLAAFPIRQPRYLVLTTLFDPMPGRAKKARSAAKNAAPLTGRIIQRIAPLLGVARVKRS